MVAKVKMVDGLVWSGRGNSPWWGVGKNSANGGQFYVVADLKCSDGKIRTRSYRPDGFNMTEREAAIIATELYRRNGEPLPEGSVIDPNFPTGIKFKVAGRFIKCIDRHGCPIITSEALNRRGPAQWMHRDHGENTASKSGNFAPVAGAITVRPVNSLTPDGLMQEAERQLQGKVSEGDWFLTKTVMQDAMGQQAIHPAVKKLVKSLLEMEPV